VTDRRPTVVSDRADADSSTVMLDGRRVSRWCTSQARVTNPMHFLVDVRSFSVWNVKKTPP